MRQWHHWVLKPITSSGLRRPAQHQKFNLVALWVQQRCHSAEPSVECSPNCVVSETPVILYLGYRFHIKKIQTIQA